MKYLLLIFILAAVGCTRKTNHKHDEAVRLSGDGISITTYYDLYVNLTNDTAVKKIKYLGLGKRLIISDTLFINGDEYIKTRYRDSSFNPLVGWITDTFSKYVKKPKQ